MALEEFEFREILKKCGLNQKEFAKKVGMSHVGVRNGLSRGTKKGVSVWLKAFLLGWNLREKKNDPSGDGEKGLLRGANSDVVGRELVVECDDCVYESLENGKCIVVMPCAAHIGGFNEYFKK